MFYFFFNKKIYIPIQMQRKSFGWFTYAHSLNNQTSANYRNIQMNWWASKRKPRSSENSFFSRWFMNRFHQSKLTNAHWNWFLGTERWIPSTTINLYCFDHHWTQFCHLHFNCIICSLFLPFTKSNDEWPFKNGYH